MRTLRGLSLKDMWSLTRGYVLLILIAVNIGTWYPHDWWISELFYHLADALIIAGVLAIFVELGAANRLIQHVGDDIAEKLVGRGLPKALQAKIKQIVNTSIVRDNYVKTYRLTKTGAGRMCLDIGLSFDVKNYSDGAVDYAPTLAEEVFYNLNVIYLEYGLPGSKGHSFSREELQPLTKERPETRVKSIEGLTEVRIPPLAESPNTVCKVRWQYRIDMPEDYTDITSFSAPTVNVTLHLLDSPPDFNFTANGPNMEHRNGSKTWTFPGPLLEGEHVRTWWFHRS